MKTIVTQSDRYLQIRPAFIHLPIFSESYLHDPFRKSRNRENKLNTVKLGSWYGS